MGSEMCIRDRLGTVAKIDETGEVLQEVIEKKDYLVFTGGRGGRGNARFKSATNRTPDYHQLGEPGTECWVRLDLKLMADVGLVGFPNAGKSSLLSVLSAAKPKVANYPFTTLQPSVGVVQFNSMMRATLADIPGIIEGAHENVGLGHDFLRHIMRCKLLIFVVDIAGVDMRDPIEDVQTLRKEIKLYSDELASRDWMIIANKMDIDGASVNFEFLRTRFPKIETIGLSALTGEGVEVLKKRLEKLIGKEVS